MPAFVAPADLGDDDLDLVGLLVLGEDGAERLGVGIGERPCGDVGSVVGVAPQVGVADAGDPQVLELVVLADPGEGNAVVDLADLVERAAARVVGDEEDALVVAEDDDRAAAGDAGAGELRPVGHDLLRGDVEGWLRHARPPPP